MLSGMGAERAVKVKKRLATATASLPGSTTDTADALRAEVRSFAAQLGLAAHDGDQAGFDDRDFRPEAAAKRVGKRPQATNTVERGPTASQKPTASLTSSKLGSRKKQKLEPQERADGKHNIKQHPQSPATALPTAAPAAVASAPVVARAPSSGPQSGPDWPARQDEPSLWYEAAAAVPAPDLPSRPHSHSAAERSSLQSEAQSALEAEAARFAKALGRKSAGDQRWLQQVRNSGTVSDKLAAMTLQLQESAVANLKTLDELMKWATKHSGARGVAGQAIDALAEVFVVALLPDWKLKAWSEQQLPSGPATKKETRRCLMYMHLEDCIKTRYAKFIGVLEIASRDNLEFIKDKAIRALAKLLAAKPEQEARLLAALVNKLGDPSRKLASKVGYLLGEMLHEHPRMAMVVVREVERFTFRPGLAPRARYYAVVFLNQLQLSHNPAFGGSELAEKLIEIYFAIFSLLMTAKPAEEPKPDSRKQHQPIVKGKKHKARAAQKQPARGRPQQKKAKDDDEEPQTKEVDARMLGALLAGVRRAFPYVESANADALADKHSQSLFRISHAAPLGVGLQSLALLFQLMSAQSAASDRFYRALYAIMLSPEIAASTRAPMLFSLTFKALQADPKSARVAAFAKRLLQLALAYSPAFACGCLLLLSQILQERPGLWNAVLEPEEGGDDDIERFQDAPEPESEADEQPPAAGSQQRDEAEAAQAPRAAAGPSASRKAADDRYDMRKREPAYCGADKAAWWEVGLLTQHWHPSVAAFARSLSQGQPISYAGDPLKDLSLTAFLDKFVQRKPKAGKTKGRSLMQPLAAGSGQPSSAAIGSAAFAALAERDVPADALIFHKFYSIAAQRAAKGQSKRAKRRRGDDDEAADSEVSESDIEADDVLAAEEDMGEEGGGADPNAAFDYSQLAAAIQADYNSPDARLPDAAAAASASDSGADPADSDDDEDEDDLEGMLMASGVSDSEGDAAAGAEMQQQDADGSDAEEVNPFELPSGSDSDLADAAPADGFDTDALPGALRPEDSDSDSGSWVMHDPAFLKRKASQPSSQPGGKPTKRVEPRSSKPAFADADDYAQLLDKFELEAAAQPAADKPGEGSSRRPVTIYEHSKAQRRSFKSKQPKHKPSIVSGNG